MENHFAEIMTCLIYYTTKYLITNGSKAEALLKLNNLLNDKSLHCIVGSKSKFSKQVAGNMVPFVGFALIS